MKNKGCLLLWGLFAAIPLCLSVVGIMLFEARDLAIWLGASRQRAWFIATPLIAGGVSVFLSLVVRKILNRSADTEGGESRDGSESRDAEDEWVYVLQNPAFPEKLKIGHTARTPKKRAKELSSGTGVPESYRVVAKYSVYDSRAVERTVHEKLKSYRTNDDREFFDVSLSKAEKTIQWCITERSD